MVGTALTGIDDTMSTTKTPKTNSSPPCNTAVTSMINDVAGSWTFRPMVALETPAGSCNRAPTTGAKHRSVAVKPSPRITSPVVSLVSKRSTRNRMSTNGMSELALRSKSVPRGNERMLTKSNSWESKETVKPVISFRVSVETVKPAVSFRVPAETAAACVGQESIETIEAGSTAAGALVGVLIITGAASPLKSRTNTL